MDLLKWVKSDKYEDKYNALLDKYPKMVKIA